MNLLMFIKSVIFLFTFRLCYCCVESESRIEKNLLSGRSSGVERNLAKVEVVGSNPIARSNTRYLITIA